MATRALARTRTRTVFVRSKAARRGRGKVSLAVVAGFVPLGIDAFNSFQRGWSGYTGLEAAAGNLVYNTTGWNNRENRWELRGLIRGMGPIAAGAAVHWFAGKIGINRQIGKLRLPFSI